MRDRIAGWVVRQYCLDWGGEDDGAWRMLESVKAILEGNEKGRHVVEWINRALDSDYCRKSRGLRGCHSKSSGEMKCGR